MRVAVACRGLTVAPYFVQCTSYTVYTVNRGIITDSHTMPALDQPIGKLVELLKSIDVDALIVGLIEYDLAAVLCRNGIEVVAGAEGSALDVVKAFVSNTLAGIEEVCAVGDFDD